MNRLKVWTWDREGLAGGIETQPLMLGLTSTAGTADTRRCIRLGGVSGQEVETVAIPDGGEFLNGRLLSLPRERNKPALFAELDAVIVLFSGGVIIHDHGKEAVILGRGKTAKGVEEMALVLPAGSSVMVSVPGMGLIRLSVTNDGYCDLVTEDPLTARLREGSIRSQYIWAKLGYRG